MLVLSRACGRVIVICDQKIKYWVDEIENVTWVSLKESGLQFAGIYCQPRHPPVAEVSRSSVSGPPHHWLQSTLFRFFHFIESYLPDSLHSYLFNWLQDWERMYCASLTGKSLLWIYLFYRPLSSKYRHGPFIFILKPSFPINWLHQMTIHSLLT